MVERSDIGMMPVQAIRAIPVDAVLPLVIIDHVCFLYVCHSAI